MPEIDLREYEHAAAGSNVYRGVELELLMETLNAWKERPGDPYILLDLRDGRTLAAFALICRASNRNNTYEIRYLCVDRDYRATIGGARIFEMIDEEVLRRDPYALLQYETSRKKLSGLGQATPEAAGYRMIGHIPDFYAEGNDYYLYARMTYRNPPPPREARADDPAGVMESAS